MNHSLATKIKSAINKSKHILLHLHPSPDGDSIGSALAMYHYLKSIKKDVTLIKGDSELPQYLDSLPGYGQIIGKNIFDIDLKSYDLFIILDSSAPNQISKLGNIVFPNNLTKIVIDHHASNQNYGDINYVDDKSPATAQLVCQLFDQLEISISPDMAICLFVGIYQDTGGFKYSNTTSVTFSIASKLTKINPEFPKYIFNMENNNDPEHIIFKGLALSHIETYFNNHVAVSAISLKDLETNRISKKYISPSDIANTIKSVVGWDIGISLIETDPNICSLSFRTRDSLKYNLSTIASKVGEGGGHAAAAGSTIYLPFKKAKKHLLNTIKQLYPEIENS